LAKLLKKDIRDIEGDFLTEWNKKKKKVKLINVHTLNRHVGSTRKSMKSRYSLNHYIYIQTRIKKEKKNEE
jgi:hypothetical protein